MSNHRIGKRRHGIHYDYDGDGRFSKEKWTEEDKRYWTRWLRRLRKQEVIEEIEDYLPKNINTNINNKIPTTSE
jgi:hypothetical protein